MKKCELCCNRAARMYCDSDKASLCWDCDSRVHTANFLVARHTRTLLCHACHSPTPWTASGPNLAPTVSVCESCIHATTDRDSRRDQNRSVKEDDDDESENQVVPLFLSSSSTTKNGGFSYHVTEKGEDCGGGKTSRIEDDSVIEF